MAMAPQGLVLSGHFAAVINAQADTQQGQHAVPLGATSCTCKEPKGPHTSLAHGASDAQGAVAAAGKLRDLALHKCAIHIVAALQHHLWEVESVVGVK